VKSSTFLRCWKPSAYIPQSREKVIEVVVLLSAGELLAVICEGVCVCVCVWGKILTHLTTVIQIHTHRQIEHTCSISGEHGVFPEMADIS